MCIPYGVMSSKDNGYVETKPKKHIKKVSQREFEKGDPDFVDEGIEAYTPKKKGSFFDNLFS
ncbi:MULTISPECIES: hypothetical protein [Sulfurimonas]|uniref:hypothetical protein n=1 Tax=Sulfurimonas TaxID=202746 RepID=UPI00126421C2|nr:hypothetical protein [Sulfurimonas indica]